ncbi:inositolphosphorylceramide-B C-26 hydroxylase [Paracoccidioides lutzii Pb01]|uniref:Ceramide very long chain fatty acid hydroxylase n=1 Tax=Paracoccidioides lutzii (strain ATCC MYA-826 / Pb01) TaxID=502779 RepID=C1H3H8_PARBA|nr:inositolphosphorylceramide-B C-26 hydroxylase [Paracoccidioides lutzii Pb01]EEH34272.1 inositolphosphorylceramide-B C-26 hydroxylase [Paracoccidioides lutzii Pb01]
MLGRTLPVFSPAELKSHTTEKSCYVTRGSKVYDVTSFLNDHPGGGELILNYAGQDVSEIMHDISSHDHSEAAYEILEEYHVGFLDCTPASSNMNGNGAAHASNANGLPNGTKPVYSSTGMSGEEDLSVETDLTADYRTHKFLDLNRPLFGQLWNGGFSKEFYLKQVHRPRHYKGGESAPLFGNFLEPLTKTAWWVIPTVWFPPVAYGTVVGFCGLQNFIIASAYWLLGLFLWTLAEYSLHRFVFHIDKYLPDNRVGLCLHFLLHGIHHYLPMDKYRLVMPPSLFIVLAIPFYYLAKVVFFYNWYAAVTVYSGGIFGYVCYDMTHYFLHHRNLPYYYKELKKYHLQHHFADYENGFGVSNRFWDKVFGTELPPLQPVKVE